MGVREDEEGEREEEDGVREEEEEGEEEEEEDGRQHRTNLSFGSFVNPHNAFLLPLPPAIIY